MRFLHELPGYDLTYNDVFFVPSYTDLASRFEVDLTSPDPVGATTPLVVSNMNAVAGKRLAETLARRGGLVILPQDIPMDVLAGMIKYIKTRHPIYETPLKMTPEHTISDALGIIHKRSHGAVIIVDKSDVPLGIFTEQDAEGYDLFTQLGNVMSTDLISVKAGQSIKSIFAKLHRERVSVAPVIESGKMIGVMTQKGALRSNIYKPLLDNKGCLKVGVAIGINGDVTAKAAEVVGMGADVLVVDTAHGHQKKMLDALRIIRRAGFKIPIVAGNVVTPEGTSALIEAGADIVKVGVGPGAMCTTRMMTGVGRPQFSAILECAPVAKQLGKHIWSDGGIRHPRDVALSLAAGASSSMFGSWWAATHESAGDVLSDNQGRLYKENYGMASKRAVQNRNRQADPFELAKRELFEEGISKGHPFINPDMPGAEDLIDHIVGGVRSSMSYAGSRNIEQFQEKAVIGIQSSSGYQEGRAVETNWS